MTVEERNAVDMLVAQAAACLRGAHAIAKRAQERGDLRSDEHFIAAHCECAIDSLDRIAYGSS